MPFLAVLQLPRSQCVHVKVLAYFLHMNRAEDWSSLAIFI